MSDPTPEPTERRQMLVAPLIIGGVVVLLLVLALLPRGPEKTLPTPTPAPKVENSSRASSPVVVPQALTRQDLIERAAIAAAAYADATDIAESALKLSGRNFSLRLPFACNGTQDSASNVQAFSKFDAEKGVLKLTARPMDLSGRQPFWASASPEIEKIEGFWIPRPWSYSEACPKEPNQTQPVEQNIEESGVVEGPTLGIVQMFTKDGSRVLRRDGRPYEFTRKTPKDEAFALLGPFYLVLEGRVLSFNDGLSIKCHSESAERRPVCIVSVAFERVAFESAGGEQLAEWRE